MESIAKVRCCHQPLNLSMNCHPPSFPKPVRSLAFRTLPSRSSSSTPFMLSSIRASSLASPQSSGVPLYQTPKSSLLQTVRPLLKTTCITLTGAAALFFARLHVKPAFAAPVAAAGTEEHIKESLSNENVSLEEQERILDEHLSRNPDNVEVLRSLMEVKIKSRKLPEAIECLDRLIELEPTEDEWPLLKGQIYNFSGDTESARKLFEEILEKDPLRVEAYHGLLMANSEAGEPFHKVLEKIELAMEKCKKEKKKSDLRDFKLLIAQVRVMEEKYSDALNVYEELVKEEPRDFRPYLCQGIIYTLMRKKDEAKKKFDQFRKLVPKNHPYREYFLDNMFATKFFSEKVDRERAVLRS
uniref:Uncharacterized protein n=1 Tax=Rhizophora mucronata TaxID=61149 RepID=A0A2P2J616_RHIMU